ncbi:MgtC/SapB family protein [Radicibacter daui]|uniref:MgtC/SapB family protein n=1 Tax=Radicibacter daui TaxID=3064829 RepID=UPI0040470411
MSSFDQMQRLGVALAIGLLVGLVRGWQDRDQAESQRVAGLRTYALSALMGGVSGVLTPLTTPLMVPLALAAYCAAMLVFFRLQAIAQENFSVTGLVAGLLTFVLGAYAVLGELEVAVAAAVASMVLLALRQPLHAWVQRISWIELRAVIILLAMSFLLLPLLPDRTFDPWQAINPAQIWLLAIIIAGISFVGYVAIRLMGENAGVLAASLAGGLASSTATTVTFSRMAKESPQAAPLLAGGILMAGATMFVRVLIVASVVNQSLLTPLLAPLLAPALIMALAGGWLLRRRAGREKPADIQLSNPFDLGTALKLAGLIALISLLSRLLNTWLGGGGVLALAAISGLADVDAITLSLSRMPAGDIAQATVVAGIAIVCAVNTLTKAGLAWTLGGRRLGIITGGVSLAAVLISGLLFLAPALP